KQNGPADRFERRTPRAWASGSIATAYGRREGRGSRRRLPRRDHDLEPSEFGARGLVIRIDLHRLAVIVIGAANIAQAFLGQGPVEIGPLRLAAIEVDRLVEQ